MVEDIFYANDKISIEAKRIHCSFDNEMLGYHIDSLENATQMLDIDNISLGTGHVFSANNTKYVFFKNVI